MLQCPTTLWESKAALEKYMRSNTSREFLIVGKNAEAPRRFYSVSISTDFGKGVDTEIGIYTSSLGTPSVFLGDEIALFCHDDSLTWINIRHLSVITSLHLLGQIAHAEPREKSKLMVIHEIGALLVDLHGAVLWKLDVADVVEDYQLQGDILSLTLMEQSAPLKISITSGERIS